MQLILALFFLAIPIQSWSRVVPVVPSNYEGWVLAFITEKSSWYYEPKSHKKNWNIHKVWEIQNSWTNDIDGNKSFRTLKEYDCKNEKFRILSSSTHSKHFAEGNLLTQSSSTSEWIYIPPNTAAESMMNIICKL